MKHKFTTILFFIFSVSFSFSQSHLVIYQSAFDEMMSMIKNENPVDLKRAVFLAENAYYDNTLNYSTFCAEIDKHIVKIKDLIKSQPADAQKFKTIGHWAIFAYMTAELPENDHKPFLYDFDNFLPSQNQENSFVTKLLQTKKGNCQSLPYLYKIFANEIGAEAHLAFAPMHCYIKHKDEEGKWRNVELTNGSLARDVWIIQSMGITSEQIASGMYMRAITEKECIATCISDLLTYYDRRYLFDLFTLPMIDTVLSYYPNDYRFLIHKFNTYDILMFYAKKQQDTDYEAINDYTAKMNDLQKKINELGYVQGDFREYEKWAESEGRKINEEYQERRKQEQKKLN